MQPSSLAACPVCKGTDFRPKFKKQGQQYWACRRCRFVFARSDRNANFADLSQFEPAYLEYLEKNETSADHVHVVGWIREFVDVGHSAILDVGCGNGAFVRHLADTGADAVGIEPARAVYERYLAADPRFILGALERCSMERRFDVVTMLDVIEHVERPDRMVSAARTVLRNGGYVFVSTPDIGSRAARLSGRHWHFMNRYHLSYFSRETLATLFANHGFELVDVRSMSKEFTLGYLARYAGDFMLGRPVTLPAALRRQKLRLNTGETMYACFRGLPDEQRGRIEGA